MTIEEQLIEASEMVLELKSKLAQYSFRLARAEVMLEYGMREVNNISSTWHKLDDAQKADAATSIIEKITKKHEEYEKKKSE